MSKSEEYKKKIQALNAPELITFWQNIVERNTPEWTSGKALEYAFEEGGADVTYPYEILKEGKLIEQIDGVVYCQHIACLIECKDYEQDKINFSPLAKMRSQLLRRPSSTIGSIFSITGFTEPTIILAGNIAPQTILLWEETEIEYVVSTNKICKSLIEKYRYFTERCIPDLNTKPI